jgi:hypothetical protein
MDNDASDLGDLCRELLSPGAIAAIVAALQTMTTTDDAVNGELQWVSHTLTTTLGGADGFNRIMDEIGV